MITLAIVTYNRPEDMRSLLENLSDIDDIPEQIVIVDDSENRDTEETVEELRENIDSEIDYSRSGEKRTFGESRNEAIEMAENEVVAFIDDDTHLPENYFTVMRKAYEEYPEAAGIGGPAITTDRDLNKLVEILESDEVQNKFNKYGEVRDESDRWIPSEPKEVDTFRGANMSFRKEKLEEIGGFDPGYKGTGFREEQDVMVRLRKNGEKLIYHPKLKLHHIRAEAGGTRDVNVETEYWKGRNIIYFVKKNFSDNFKMAMIRLALHTDGFPPPLWKDFVGALVYRQNRIPKWRGYYDEIVR